jgi:oligosaccharide repeat unit polymerase
MTIERVPNQVPPPVAGNFEPSKQLLFLVWALFILTLYGLLALLNQLPDPLIPFLLAISWGLLFLPLFIHRPLDWFAPPIFLLWWGIKGFFRPLTWLIQGEIDVNLPTSLDENLSLLRWVLLAHIVASATYLLAFYGRRQAEWARRVNRYFDLRQFDDWQSSRLMSLFLFTLPIAAASYFFILYTSGIESLWELIMSWRSKQQLLEGKFYSLTAIMLFALIVLMILSYGWHAKRSRLYQWLALVGLLIYSVAIALFGLRGYVVRVWVMAAGMFHYLVQRLSLLQIGVLIGSIFLFALLSYQVRRAAFQGEIKEGHLPSVAINFEVVTQLIDEDLATRGLDNQLIALYVFPNHIPFQWGKSWLALLALPVPRALWEEKPVMTPGGLVRDKFYGGGGSLPLGYLGDLYANFHLPGVLLGYWLLGLYHRFLYEWLLRKPKNLSVTFLYIVFLTNLLDFSPLSLVHGVIYCLPALLLVKLVSVKRL